MYIYALGDPRTQEIHYIGIAKDVYKRYAQHLNRPHANKDKNAWMAEIKAAGVVPTLAILESNVDEITIYEREKYWIQYYLSQGAPLTNRTHTLLTVLSEAKITNEGDLLPLASLTSIHLLFEDMPISIRQLSFKLGLNEVTLARIRDGRPTSEPSANKLLLYFSETFKERYTLRNVSGINIKKEEGHAAKS